MSDTSVQSGSFGTEMLKPDFRDKWKAVLFGIIGCVALWFVLDHIAYSMTDSVGFNFFIRKNLSSNAVIERGDYLSFTSTVPVKEKWRKVKEVKKVVCLPGDILRVSEDALPVYTCNNTHLGMGKSKTPSGIPLTQFRYNGYIPSGSYFVWGGNENSYDSRYYGFVKREAFLERFFPVW